MNKTAPRKGAVRRAAPPTVLEKLRASEKRYRELLSQLPVGVYRTTPDNHIVTANPALIRMLGYENEAELSRVDIKDLYVRARDRAAHLKRLEKKAIVCREFQLRRKDGRIIWVRDHPRAITGKDGVIAYFDGILVDIGTEIKAKKNLKAALTRLGRSRHEREGMIEQLKQASITDEMTGLFNRSGFFTVAREYIGLAVRRKTKMFLLYMDMDGLKQVNDTFGHHIGDQALVLLADLLKQTFRTSDVKGRMGGDEFAVFPIDSSLDGVEVALARLQKAIDECNASSEKPFRLSISTGLAFFDPEFPTTIDDLLVRADKQMYERKRSKRGEC
jgi:diguanylate cyclase (GGDEF)-like protein/PAS domain S-box-containing protein